MSCYSSKGAHKPLQLQNIAEMHNTHLSTTQLRNTGRSYTWMHGKNYVRKWYVACGEMRTATIEYFESRKESTGGERWMKTSRQQNAIHRDSWTTNERWMYWVTTKDNTWSQQVTGTTNMKQRYGIYNVLAY